MVELRISMYFQQFEDLKFHFLGGACPRTLLKPLKILLENLEKKITINIGNLFDIAIDLRVLEMAF